jgi:uncharacterized protein YbbC (DUF1343 family)
MKRLKIFEIVIIALLLSMCIESNENEVKPGVEVFVEKHLNIVEGKKVGLITNPTGVNNDIKSTIDVLLENGVNLVALYGPEHGVRGNAQAGEYVPFYWDDKYNLPVFSLYGQGREVPADMLTNIDEYMKDFDTKHEGKVVDREMVEGIDVMIFDIQDVGTRVYTYIATMAYAMRSCAELGIDFIVLDRPNPIGGTIEGPVLDYPEYSSFVGLYAIPMRHGMTAGELAKLFNERFMDKKVNLTVIEMEGWNREMWYDETALPWVIPSPNMPTLDTATVYPGQVLIEGTSMSEGRGTTKPFELFGAPWIDGYKLAKELNALQLPGVIFREAWFTPTFSKYKGELCGGAQIHVIDREEYKPFETALYILETVKKLYPDNLTFDEHYFDRLVGNSWIREALELRMPVARIVDRYQKELGEFREMSRDYLIYG